MFFNTIATICYSTAHIAGETALFLTRVVYGTTIQVSRELKLHKEAYIEEQKLEKAETLEKEKLAGSQFKIIDMESQKVYGYYADYFSAYKALKELRENNKQAQVMIQKI